MADTDFSQVTTSYDDVRDAIEGLVGNIKPQVTMDAVNQAVESATSGIVKSSATDANNDSVSYLGINKSGNNPWLLNKVSGETVWLITSANDYATNPQLASYLPLSGGTITGAVKTQKGMLSEIWGVDTSRKYVTQIFWVHVNTATSPCLVYFPTAFATTDGLHIQVSATSDFGPGDGASNISTYLASPTVKGPNANTAESFWIDTGYSKDNNGYYVTASGYMS